MNYTSNHGSAGSGFTGIGPGGVAGGGGKYSGLTAVTDQRGMVTQGLQ